MKDSKSMMNIQYVKTPYGELILGSFKGALVLCDWRCRKMREAVDNRIQRLLNTTYHECGDHIIEWAVRELFEYFEGNRREFSVPLSLVGTTFQQQVWQQLQKVEYATTDSYMQLALAMGDANKVRAVATANGANALSIIVPCHRIIGSDGKLVGYAGGLAVKEKLLQLEASTAGINTMTHSLHLF